MDIDVKPIRSFIGVAETLSFSKAANQLNITQPALSAQIRTLERTIGFALFTRSTRAVELTPNGDALLKDARRLQRESDRFKAAVRTISASLESRLRLGAAFYTLEIAERNLLIDAFLEAYPDIEVTVDTSWQSVLLDELLEGALDLVMLISMPVTASDYENTKDLRQPTECMYPNNLAARVIRRERVQLLVPIESPLAGYTTIPQSALSEQQLVTLSIQHGHALINPITELIRSANATSIVPPEGHGIGVEHYARTHRKPAFSLGWFSARHEDDNMVRRPIEGFELSTEFVLLSRKETQSACVTSFLESVDD